MTDLPDNVVSLEQRRDVKRLLDEMLDALLAEPMSQEEAKWVLEWALESAPNFDASVVLVPGELLLRLISGLDSHYPGLWAEPAA